MIESFKALGLSQQSLDAIEAKGFDEPTDIQKACIPLLLQEDINVIGQARTGTGKTAAFALPILDTIEADSHEPQAIVLTPTRELCVQIAQETQSLEGSRKTKILSIYGGAPYDAQLRALKAGVQIVIGTPGRVLDHLERGTLKLDNIKVCVLDEADEMLDMGFIEDIEAILAKMPEKKRMLLFSATMPQSILKLAETFMSGYKLVRIESDSQEKPLTRQVSIKVRESDKLEALCRIIEVTEDFYGLVFCKTKIQCDELGARLFERGYNAEALHGDLSQKQRESILSKMKAKHLRILAATDVAARGIDIQDLTHVINYSLPQDGETYIHRIGRTGRAGKTGMAITFYTEGESRKMAFLKKAADVQMLSADVPTVNEILEFRKRSITNAVLNAPMEQQATDSLFSSLADQLLQAHEAKAIISSLLEKDYAKLMDLSAFKPIVDLSKPPIREKRDKDNASGSRLRSEDEDLQYAGLDEKGMTRLFIARGKQDGMTKRMLVDFLLKSVKTPARDIQDVDVHDTFSLISAPFATAEAILSQLNKGSGRPIARHDFKAGQNPRKRGHKRP
ncbi:MAG: DEAD/DEAH box helicase [Sphaerochaetaceae bacterium]